jgi:integrase
MRRKKRGTGNTIPVPLADLMGEKLSSLTSDRLETWAAKEAPQRPARARLALRLMGGFLSWCTTHKDYKHAVQRDAAKSRRVREKLGDPVKQKLVLRREQLSAWFAAVQKIGNPVISGYLQFMLFNGPRPNEPLSLKWDDINFQWRTITIRDKVEGERVIGLTPY